MSQLEFRPTRKRDAELIEPQPWQVNEHAFLRSIDWDDYAKRGFALTGLRRGEPLVIAGVHQMMPGVGEGWMMLSREVGPREMVIVARNVCKIIDAEMRTAYHRVQAYIADEFAAGNRFADLLGMTREGLMIDFPKPGDRYALYARTR